MDPKWLLSLSLLLLFSLGFELSYGTGGGDMNCPKIFRGLGSNTLLPLTHERINKSMNKSIRIVVTMAKSRESSTKTIIVSHHTSDRESPLNPRDGYQFHLENLTLEILRSRKENEGWYFITLEESVSVKQYCVELKLYEQVSTPEIRVLNRTWESENGTCRLKLACMVEKGDHVVYNWTDEGGTHLESPNNNSHFLYITIGPHHADNIYICKASNPVSNGTKAFNPSGLCRSDSSESRQWALSAGLFLGGIVSFIIILIMVIQLLRRGKVNHFQSPITEENLTIYAQVQQPGTKPESLPHQDPCTTIYMAATEPVPESVQEPNLITVYASVTPET
ncbi:signaling lymphocytic activation molecule [Perognathus longimembris pacificus]|uniref:signaling lymphocytic activation molecule n=1 Tax=Perognathus longimembris pacificus TaxID=214514 RepID=UPI002019C407|nr:signaling lymphocytic activation molecule [Perognathus longimembris pacificus]